MTLKVNKLSLIQDYLICPFCASGARIEVSRSQLKCQKCGKVFDIVGNNIPSMVGGVTSETGFSMGKWDEIYKNKTLQKKLEKEYRQWFLNDVKRQALEYTIKNLKMPKTILEIGCGLGFLGEAFAKDGWLFIGVDFSISALKSLEGRLGSRGIKNYLLVHGDIQSLPIRSNSIDLIVGDGVIEHFKNTQIVVNNCYRVLKKGGVSFNSVPYFNLGNLFYRFSWGSIPNVPILKQLSEFIHLKVKKGRHMVFGYELQFTASQLRKLHAKSGYKNIIIERFDCYILLGRVKNRLLKEFLINVCKTNRQFWPMVKVIGIK